MYRIIILYMILILKNSIYGLNKLPEVYISSRKIKDLYKEIYGNKFKTPNLEHVVPQSRLKNDPILKKDMHNILFYPRMLNIHRSNYKYTNDKTIYEKSIILDKYGYLISENKIYDEKVNSIKTSQKKIFCPSSSLRGEISRSCLYFIYTYNKYKEVVLNEVISKDSLIEWHEEYPVTEKEEYKNYRIGLLQGNENIFISKPNQIYKIIDHIKK